MNDKLKREIDQLARRSRGRVLKPEAMVEEGRRRPGSELHKNFEWDDTEAGRLYRLDQARSMIRVYDIVMPQTERRIRAFISLPTDRANGGGYRETLAVLGDNPLRAQMVEDVFKEVDLVPDRFNYLTELDPFFNELRAAVEKHRRRTSVG